MRALPASKGFWILLSGFLLGVFAISATAYSFVATSDSRFCMSCHEMRVVGEQGWMQSAHYNNPKGVVAGCADCHIPPGVVDYTVYKVRDGIKDVLVHTFGESDPYKMDWERLKGIARHHHKDSACLRCHENLEPKGMEIKGLIAHREYLRGETEKNCIECHDGEMHPKFKTFLFGEAVAERKGVRP